MLHVIKRILYYDVRLKTFDILIALPNAGKHPFFLKHELL